MPCAARGGSSGTMVQRQDGTELKLTFLNNAPITRMATGPLVRPRESAMTIAFETLRA